MPTPAPALNVVAAPKHRLTHDKDVWVASASADGAPYLVPLSFDCDGQALLMATATDSPTGSNRPPPGPFGSGWATLAAWMPWFLRRARPRPASAGRASRHLGPTPPIR